MMFRVHKTILRSLYLILAATMLLVVSCVEKLYDDSYMYREGVETNISLKISVPEMTIATRADMPDGADTQLNSLWVGIFSATTGELKYARLLSSNELGGLQKAEHGNFYKLPDITVKSGPSYIVAVGNPADNLGYKYNKENPDEQLKETDLSDLLPKGTQTTFNWDDYCAIATRLNEIRSIGTPSGNLLMSGIYYAGTGDHGANGKVNPTPSGWEEANYEPVSIPVAQNGSYTMQGAIHLRRSISQIKFNIQAADGPTFDGTQQIRIVSIEPLSYTVYNVPVVNWLHERKSSNNATDATNVTNAGDAVRIQGLNYDGNALPLKANYITSTTYSDITSSEDGVYSFDFWMLENKRNAVDGYFADYDKSEDQYNTLYFKREAEYKTEGEQTDGKKRYDNSGIYKALCKGNGNDWEESYNNCATYVAIECQVEYTARGIQDVNDNGYEYEQESGELQTRIANVIYYVHLGAIDRELADFNNRRNHKYTYNIKVADIKTLIVEAKGNELGEERPGFEGVVIDSSEKPFELDAHYNVFNIKLKNSERRDFKFRLQVYDLNGKRLDIDNTNLNQFPQMYSDWIEFRATSGENVLARYYPYGMEPTDGNPNKTFRLGDVKDLETTYPPYEGYSESDTNEHWYTVFINEYVYEPGKEGELTNNIHRPGDIKDEVKNAWVGYVNKPKRWVWLDITSDVSADKETSYIRAKYSITQRSIQTFYDSRGVDVSDATLNAIGLEHINETLGHTLVWNDYHTQRDNDVEQYYLNNGRLNQWNYIKDGLNNELSYTWNLFQNVTTPEHKISIPETGQGAVLLADYQDFDVYLRQMRDDNGQSWAWRSTDNPSDDPSTTYIHAMKACLNRNRDNNGDGVISVDELRWYLPASGELLDLLVGRNSLTTSLLDYKKNDVLQNWVATTNAGGPFWGHWFNTRFHFAASNKRTLWAEEGMTTSDYPDKPYSQTSWGFSKRPWQVRCARVLGINLGNAISNKRQNLTPAFEWEVDEAWKAAHGGEEVPGRIYPTYFEDQTLRTYYPTPLPVHEESSPLNRLCYYGFELKNEALAVGNFSRNDYSSLDAYNGYIYYVFKGNSTLSSKNAHDAYAIQANDLCQRRYGENWRLPNLKEIALMKAAWNAAGYNDGTPIKTGGKVHNAPLQNYLSCTCREYDVDANDGVLNNYKAAFGRTGLGYYCGIITDKERVDPNNNNSEVISHSDRINILTQEGINNPDNYYYIRCVRDLTKQDYDNRTPVKQ